MMKTLSLLLVLALLNAPTARAAGVPAGEPLQPAAAATQTTPARADLRWTATVTSDDGSSPVPPQLRPYDAVGLILNADHTRTGTGFLIGPCTVLTAYHVLFPAGEAASKKARFTFSLGHGMSRQFELALPARPVFWGNFSYDADTPTEDFAVLDVPACPGKKYLPIPLAAMSLDDIARAGGRMTDAGYPVGHSWGRVWGDEDCTAGGMHPLEPTLFAVDCFARPGMSGGPIFAEKDGQLLAVAIMSRVVADTSPADTLAQPAGSSTTELARFNLALPVYAFLDRLTAMGLVSP